jgi:ABC-type Fe3+-hydroxamate transport system substrate-binding protein
VVRCLLISVLIVTSVLACAPERQSGQGEVRIISLAPALTETLLALGARDQLVGVDRYSKRIPGLEGVPSLGALFSPDFERSVELRPTLLVGIESAQQHEFFEQLRRRGTRVEIFAPYTLDEVLASYERLGELAQRPEAGRALRARVAAEIAALEAEMAPASRRTVAVLVEREPLHVVGGGSYVSALISAAGGENVFRDLEAPYPNVSLEVLAARAPEVLIDTTATGAGDLAAEQAARSHWSRFAWAGRVEVISQNVITLPGPRIAESAWLLRERIHPERAEARVP